MEWTTRQDKLFRRLWHVCRDREAAAEIGKSEKACKERAWRLRDDPSFSADMRARERDYREMLNADKSIRFLATGYRPSGNRQRVHTAMGQFAELVGGNDGGGVRQC